jgi:hypothetical protein
MAFLCAGKVLKFQQHDWCSLALKLLSWSLQSAEHVHLACARLRANEGMMSPTNNAVRHLSPFNLAWADVEIDSASNNLLQKIVRSQVSPITLWTIFQLYNGFSHMEDCIFQSNSGATTATGRTFYFLLISWTCFH